MYVYTHHFDQSTINLVPYVHHRLVNNASLQHGRHCLRPFWRSSSEAGDSGAEGFDETTDQDLANLAMGASVSSDGLSDGIGIDH